MSSPSDASSFQNHQKQRVIIDTDAKNQADDQYAIAHAILTPSFQVHGWKISLRNWPSSRGKYKPEATTSAHPRVMRRAKETAGSPEFMSLD